MSTYFYSQAIWLQSEYRISTLGVPDTMIDDEDFDGSEHFVEGSGLFVEGSGLYVEGSGNYVEGSGNYVEKKSNSLKVDKSM